MHRRDFLKLLPAAALAPKLARAAVTPSERKFLFVFCSGGWDPAYVFAPLFGREAIDMEAEAEVATAGGLSFVDHAERPSVRSFFDAHHARTCFLNGFEVSSITHERCTQLLLTGTSTPGGDDWGALLAGNAAGELLLPHLVLSGPSYSAKWTSEVVRVGPTGQLPKLLDGTALPEGIALPSTANQAKVEAFVRNRVAAAEAAARNPRSRTVAEKYAAALDKLGKITPFAAELVGGAGPDPVWGEFQTAVDCLASGFSRCAMVQYNGLYQGRWDTHADNYLQTYHFEELFQYLHQLIDALDTTPGPAGGALANEVTVVVFSEMGRGPRLNSYYGKDHYTVTSAMLFAGGVQGDRMIGEYDDDMIGRPVDLATGEVVEGGASLVTAHLGATLLAGGDVDPVELGYPEAIGGVF